MRDVIYECSLRFDSSWRLVVPDAVLDKLDTVGTFVGVVAVVTEFVVVVAALEPAGCCFVAAFEFEGEAAVVAVVEWAEVEWQGQAGLRALPAAHRY